MNKKSLIKYNFNFKFNINFNYSLQIIKFNTIVDTLSLEQI